MANEADLTACFLPSYYCSECQQCNVPISQVYLTAQFSICVFLCRVTWYLYLLWYGHLSHWGGGVRKGGGGVLGRGVLGRGVLGRGC